MHDDTFPENLSQADRYYLGRYLLYHGMEMYRCNMIALAYSLGSSVVNS